MNLSDFREQNKFFHLFSRLPLYSWIQFLTYEINHCNGNWYMWNDRTCASAGVENATCYDNWNRAKNENLLVLRNVRITVVAICFSFPLKNLLEKHSLLLARKFHEIRLHELDLLFIALRFSQHCARCHVLIANGTRKKLTSFGLFYTTRFPWKITFDEFIKVKPHGENCIFAPMKYRCDLCPARIIIWEFYAFPWQD